MGLVDVSTIDNRTNTYSVTQRGRRELDACREWECQHLDQPCIDRLREHLSRLVYDENRVVQIVRLFCLGTRFIPVHRICSNSAGLSHKTARPRSATAGRVGHSSRRRTLG